MNCPLTFEARPYLQVSRTWGQSGEDIVGRYGSANALEFKLADGLDVHGILDSHQHTRANQNLTGLGFITEPGCDVGHRPYSGIVEASLKTDGAECSKSVRYADAKANVVPKPTPFSVSAPIASRISRAIAPPGALGSRPELDR